jgi:hypothetical protein
MTAKQDRALENPLAVKLLGLQLRQELMIGHLDCVVLFEVRECEFVIFLFAHCHASSSIEKISCTMLLSCLIGVFALKLANSSGAITLSR